MLPVLIAVGHFILHLHQSDRGSSLIITNNRTSAVLWRSVPDQPFLTVSRGEWKTKHRLQQGFFTTSARWAWESTNQIVDSNHTTTVTGGVVLSGTLSGPWKGQLETCRWEMHCEAKGNTALQLSASFSDCDSVVGSESQISFVHAAEEGELFLGLGAQYTEWPLNGKSIPVLLSEQGVGRGLQPVTAVLNHLGGGAGDATTTYTAVPHYVTSQGRSVFLNTTAPARFDFRGPDAVRVAVAGEEGASGTAALCVVDSGGL